MNRQNKLSYCVTLIVLSMLACGQLQPATAMPVPSSTFMPVFTSEPALTLAPPRITPSTRAPTRTRIPTAAYPPVVPGPFRRVTSLAEPFPNLYEEVQVRAPADGSVWVITSRSAARWDGQAWNPVASMEEDMLADVDESGRLWLFRQDGDEIVVWQDGQWMTYGAGSGWTGARASAGSGGWAPKPWKVSVAADGTVWLPTETDVRHFDGQRWAIYTLEEMGFPAPEGDDSTGVVHQIALVEGGAQVWVGECQYTGPGPVSRPGVRWFDGVTWRGAETPVGSTCVSVVDVDPAGNVWIGAVDGVWRYDPARQKWTSYSLPEKFLSGYNFTYTRDLMVDRSGDIWVYLQYCGGASCDANTILHRIHAGKWSQIFEKQEWFTPLQQLALDGSGQGWLFWDGSVYQLLGDEVTAVAVLPARGMDVDPDGKVWVVTGHESDADLWVLEL
jgi:hypothetical protein